MPASWLSHLSSMLSKFFPFFVLFLSLCGDPRVEAFRIFPSRNLTHFASLTIEAKTFLTDFVS